MGLPDTPVVVSRSHDPYFNLAVEEWLLRGHVGATFQLFLYCNRPTVVLGRNQNPWLESPVAALPEWGVALARRISGGGAVYHDPGNLNLALLGPRHLYEPERHLQLVREALQRFGLQADTGNRHSLFVQGRKLTGSAFMLTGRAALQHATLLVSADLQRLERCLRGRVVGARTHAQASVRAPVGNLSTFLSGVSPKTMATAIVEAFRTRYTADWQQAPTLVPQLAAAQDPDLHGYLAKQRSRAWTFGHTPVFTQTLCGQLPVGAVELELEVREACVCRVEFRCVSCPAPLARRVEATLQGEFYDGHRLAAKVRRLEAQGPDAGGWLAGLGDWLAGAVAPGDSD